MSGVAAAVAMSAAIAGVHQYAGVAISPGAPASLMIYPGEGHHLQKPANQQDVEARTVAWFDKHLAPETAGGAQ